jgi:hypothetical protein
VSAALAQFRRVFPSFLRPVSLPAAAPYPAGTGSAAIAARAMLGQEAPLHRGRQQMQLLAGLKVMIKAVEHSAEGAGADVATREQQHLPLAVGQPVPIL